MKAIEGAFNMEKVRNFYDTFILERTRAGNVVRVRCWAGDCSILGHEWTQPNTGRVLRCQAHTDFHILSGLGHSQENKKVSGVLSLSRRWIKGKVFQDTQKCEAKCLKYTQPTIF